MSNAHTTAIQFRYEESRRRAAARAEGRRARHARRTTTKGIRA